MANDNKLTTLAEVKELIGSGPSNESGITSFIDVSIGGGYYYITGAINDYLIPTSTATNSNGIYSSCGMKDWDSNTSGYYTEAAAISSYYKYLYYGILVGRAWSTYHGADYCYNSEYQYGEATAYGTKRCTVYVPMYHFGDTTQVFEINLLYEDSSISWNYMYDNKTPDMSLSSSKISELKNMIRTGSFLSKSSQSIPSLTITKSQVRTMALRGSSSIDVYTATWEENEPVLDPSTGEQIYDDNGNALYQTVTKTDYYEEPTPVVE